MYLDKKLEIQLLKYFKSFNKKDLKGLEKLFSNDIQIIDWDNNVKKKNLGSITKSLLSSYQDIKQKKFLNKYKPTEHLFHGEDQIIKYIRSLIHKNNIK